MCGPILVTLLKMRPHDSQSSREKCNPIQRHITISLSLPSPGLSSTFIIPDITKTSSNNCLIFVLNSSRQLRISLIKYNSVLTRPSSFLKLPRERSSGLMVSALDSGSSGAGSNPGWGILRYVLGQDTLLSQCLSPPRCINGWRRI